MPRYGKKKFIRKKKVPYRKKKRMSKFSKTANISFNRSPIPKSLVTKLRYVDNISIDPAAGLASYYIFRANSVFDPDWSQTGHQPLGFDQYAALYSTYVVLGSKITVTAHSSEGSGASGSYIVGIRLDDNVETDTQAHTLQENGDNKWIFVGEAASGSSLRKLSKSFSAKRFFQVKPLSSDKMTAAITASPDDVAYYKLWCSAFDNVSNPSAMYFNISITYICMFREPKVLAAS